MRRLGAFLCLPEPPEPWHAQQAARGAPGGGQPRSPKHASSIGGGGAAGNGLAATNGHAAAAEGKEGQGVVGAAAKGELPAVEVAGADFDWADRSWAEQAGAPAQPAAADAPTPAGSQGPAAAEDGAPAAPQAQAFQLRGLRFAVPRGQLVGIVGAVGCGKSSVLAALLGELQPSRQPGSSGGQQRGRQPIAVRGSVAYCSQVPWVVSGTVKVRCHRRRCCLGAAATVADACSWRLPPLCLWPMTRSSTQTPTHPCPLPSPSRTISSLGSATMPSALPP